MKKLLKAIWVPALAVACLSFEIPHWKKGGNAVSKYDMQLVESTDRGGKVAFIQSKHKNTKGFGTLTQCFSPDNYLGKKIRMSAYAKSNDITGWAGFWLRVDQAGKDNSPFDNMHDRPIVGTTDWKKYEIILSVPYDASNIAYGCLLSGDGQIWFDDFNFEIIGSAEPKPTTPRNTNFED